MKAGETIASRFVVEALAGIGGMSSVHRGRDLASGERVAIKLLNDPERGAFRFEREAELLSRLVHPNIVKHVAHGTVEGRPYLVLEWLEGEDLETRLARQGLTLAESVALALRVAEALGAAHALGIIHRDVKPSNLFLVSGDVTRVKVLDFGIARFAAASVTRTGAMVGTPAYMSPEQARGERELDARSDVFSLGSVLFECVVGRPPFVAENPIAIVAKLMLEDAPRLSAIIHDVPPALEALVWRLLARDRQERPSSGSAVAAELVNLGSLDDQRRAEPEPRSVALTTTEQRLLGVVVIDILQTSEPEAASAPTLMSAEADEIVLQVAEIVRAHGGRVQTLAGGSVVAVFTASSGLTDQVGRAARSALALRRALPDASVALAVGRGVLSGAIPVGEVVDRALAMAVQEGRGDVSGIALDEPTARLLAPRFDVSERGSSWQLRGEAPAGSLLLGRPTRLVGRDTELSALDGALELCIDEQRAGIVVLTAPAGIGKSRLVSELLTTRADAVEIWVGAGDALSAKRPLGPIARALRAAADIQEGEPRPRQWAKLHARVARHVPADSALRISEFLAELVGAPREEASVQLAAARRDPILMGDQMLRAWLDFVGAESSARPLLLVLEDMHWGDSTSLRYASEAVEALKDRSLMVLVTGRPETFEQFPDLPELADLLDLRLKKLPRRAAEQIVRDALGQRATDELSAQLVKQADGNPLFLEELVRAAADGRGDVPDTVIAMLQARLEALETDARRVLRAASVFGEVLWERGVVALLGGAERAGDATSWLSELTRREILLRRPTSRFRDQRELAFRHALVRDAAYLMLTETDKKLGHRLAAEWLLQIGESDPGVIAAHFERSGETEPAATWALRAAEQALSANDFGRALEIAERALSWEPQGELGGRLARMVGEAAEWRGDSTLAEQASRDAVSHLPAGSLEWYDAATRVAVLECRRGEPESLLSLAERLKYEPIADERSVLSAVVPRVVPHLLRKQRADLVRALVERLSSVPRELDDPQAEGALEVALAWQTLFEGDIAASLTHDLAAARAAERAGNLRAACKHHAGAGYEQLLLGDYEAAVDTLRETIKVSEHYDLALVTLEAHHNLGLALAYLGRLAEALEVETHAIQAFAQQGDLRMEGACRMYASIILELSGELDAAEREATHAVELFRDSPANLAYGEARLAAVRLRRGDVSAALDTATHAMQLLEELAGLEDGEQAVRLAYAEALRAAGSTREAEAAIARAREVLLDKAAHIQDDAARTRYLKRVPENQKTLALAEVWLGT